MKFSLNKIQEYLSDTLPSPEQISDTFTFHLCEVEGLEECPDGDTIIDLNILPNRAHDLLGHFGVARELSGQLGIPMKQLMTTTFTTSDAVTIPSVTIETGVCNRYLSRRISTVSISQSSPKTVTFLEKLGQRSINNLVDATNEVMFITGQPTHVFDADKIHGSIIIRQSRAGESIVLLDNTEVELNENVTVIADEKNVLAIAGIKGGKSAEVDSNTKNIVLEVANFDPRAIRKTALSLKLKTDASFRFEREVPVSSADFAMELLTQFIVESNSKAEISKCTDTLLDSIEPRVIEFSINDVSKVAGTEFSNADITSILQRYQFAYIERDNAFSVTVPPHRLDLIGRHDILEEIIRIKGLDSIGPEKPIINHFIPHNLNNLITILREFFLDKGYSEVITYTFTSTGQSRVLASAGDKSYLRYNLMDGFRESLEKNARNKDILGFPFGIRQFEIGTVFSQSDEDTRLAFGLQRNKKQDKVEIESMLSELSSLLGVKIEPINNDTVLVVEFSLSTIAQSHQFESGVKCKTQFEAPTPFKDWSKYPYIVRDIAFWSTPELTEDDISTLIASSAGKLSIVPPCKFDEYEKEGRKSYAYRVVFQSYDKTLTDEEIEPLWKGVEEALIEKGCEIR